MKGRKNNPNINSRISLTGSVIENLPNNTGLDMTNNKEIEGNNENVTITNENSISTSNTDLTTENLISENTNPNTNSSNSVQADSEI